MEVSVQSTTESGSLAPVPETGIAFRSPLFNIPSCQLHGRSKIPGIVLKIVAQASNFSCSGIGRFKTEPFKYLTVVGGAVRLGRGKCAQRDGKPVPYQCQCESCPIHR